jgi:hypothetical protein
MENSSTEFYYVFKYFLAYLSAHHSLHLGLGKLLGVNMWGLSGIIHLQWLEITTKHLTKARHYKKNRIMYFLLTKLE